MNRDNVQKWVDALRFDDTLKQGRYVLVDGEVMCGLGVACKVYAEEHGITVGRAAAFIGVEDTQAFLPKRVGDWLGVDRNFHSTVVYLNDAQKKSLPEIGDWIADELLKDE